MQRLHAQTFHKIMAMKTAIGGERFTMERRTQAYFQKEFGKWLETYRSGFETKKRAPKKKRRQELATILEGVVIPAYNWSAVQALESLGFAARVVKQKAPLDFLLVNDLILEAIGAHCDEMAAEIDDTTMVNAARRFESTLAEGGTINEGREAIRDYLGDSGEGWRSFLIANTEFQVGVGTARWHVFEKSGVERKAWITAGDDRVRPTHTENEAAGYLAMDQSFSNGAMYPGDGTDDYNCRCILEADLTNPDLLLTPWDGS